MTVDVAAGQPGLLDGTAAFRVDPGRQEAELAVRRECHRLFPEEMFAAPAAPPTFATIHSSPADISQTLGENLLAVPASSSPKDLGHHHRRRDLNAHPRRTTDRGDCPRAQRTSESLLPRRTQPSVRVTESRAPRPTGLLSRSRKSPLLG